MDKNDKDFYDSYDDKSGKGVIIVFACILAGLLLIGSFFMLIDEGNPIMLLITCGYIIGISYYIYYTKKNSKLSDDFVPDNRTKEQIMDAYVYNNKIKQQRQKQAEEYLFHAAANAQAQEWLNKPKCPICGSTNLSKLSNVGKAAKIGLFGILGAGDLGKTWKCNNCGSKF